MTPTQQHLDSLLAHIGERLQVLAMGGAGRLAPVFLISSLLILLPIYLWRRPQRNFFSWVFPRSVWFHPSHITDLKLVIFLQLYSALIRIAAITTSTGVGAFIAMTVSTQAPEGAAAASSSRTVLAALVFLLTIEFFSYWYHRLYHENAILWPFHAVHHSAEVMTPITVYRKHPVYDIFAQMLSSVVVGLITGLALGITVGDVGVAKIAGLNVFYYVFNAAGANLRHSHIWISFGPIIERLVISPAQHQIHHSIDPRHHNKNYGEVLAIWDWMFGTLYVTHGMEELQFGLADAQGNRIAQPHPSLFRLLTEPFRASWTAARNRLRRLIRRPVANKRD